MENCLKELIESSTEPMIVKIGKKHNCMSIYGGSKSKTQQ